MFEGFLTLILGNIFEVLVLHVLGILLGVLISLFFWKGRVRKREVEIGSLKTSLENRDTVLKETRTRAQSLLGDMKKEIDSLTTRLMEHENRLNEKEKMIGVLNTQVNNTKTLLSEREKRLDLLETQLEHREENIQELNQRIIEKDESINRLNREAADLEKNLKSQLKEYEIRLNELEKGIELHKTQLKDYENLLNEREKREDLLNTQLEQRQENIQNLNQDLNEKLEYTNQLTAEITDLEKRHKTQLIQRNESIKNLSQQLNQKDEVINDLEEEVKDLKARIIEITVSADEKVEGLEQEFAALQARVKSMKDDLTRISGIGPKVSAVLRGAGIDSFTKLASTDIDKINEVLEAENPSLLRLTDPSSWSEQARLISEGDLARAGVTGRIQREKVLG